MSYIAQFLILCLGQTHPWLCFLAAYWAVATALSRAAMGRHYIADVAAGLLVGVGTMLLVSQVQRGTPGRGSVPSQGLLVRHMLSTTQI